MENALKTTKDWLRKIKIYKIEKFNISILTNKDPIDKEISI
jgi:hypothetical protein